MVMLGESANIKAESRSMHHLLMKHPNMAKSQDMIMCQRPAMKNVIADLHLITAEAQRAI